MRWIAFVVAGSFVEGILGSVSFVAQSHWIRVEVAFVGELENFRYRFVRVLGG